MSGTVSIASVLYMPDKLAEKDAIESVTALQWALQNHPQQTAALLLGLEASVWLHLIQDGDPWPTEWTRRRQRQRGRGRER